MLSEVRVTVRNVGLLLLQRGSHVIYAVLFAALVPRLMGPTTYGQFILLTSLAIWLVFSSSLGITQIVGRYVPEFLHRDDGEGLLKFVGHMAVTRVVVGVTGGLIYYFLTVLWLRDMDWLVLGFMALSVVLQILANSGFALFLGLNQAARWGMKETLMRWLSLVFILVGVTYWGLRGACLGMTLTELLILGVGYWWARPYLMKKYLGLDLGYLVPYSRMGIIFFISEVVLSTFQFAGSALILFMCANYNEVSFFGLAYQGSTLASLAFFQLTMAFAPFLALLLARQDSSSLRWWVEQLLKWLGVSGIMCFFGTLFSGGYVVAPAHGPGFPAGDQQPGGHDHCPAFSGRGLHGVGAGHDQGPPCHGPGGLRSAAGSISRPGRASGGLVGQPGRKSGFCYGRGGTRRLLSGTPAGAAAFLRAAVGPGPGPGGLVRAPVLAQIYLVGQSDPRSRRHDRLCRDAPAPGSGKLWGAGLYLAGPA